MSTQVPPFLQAHKMMLMLTSVDAPRVSLAKSWRVVCGRSYSGMGHVSVWLSGEAGASVKSVVLVVWQWKTIKISG